MEEYKRNEDEKMNTTEICVMLEAEIIIAEKCKSKEEILEALYRLKETAEKKNKKEPTPTKK